MIVLARVLTLSSSIHVQKLNTCSSVRGFLGAKLSLYREITFLFIDTVVYVFIYLLLSRTYFLLYFYLIVYQFYIMWLIGR